MALWGKSTTDESKPKYLTADEQLNCFASPNGWVLKRADGTEELLVAIAGLSTLLANADVNGFYFANAASAYVQGANAFVAVTFNEKVTVGGSPTVRVNGSSSNATATYSSGSGTNKLLFQFTVPSATQTLSLTTQSITLAGGSIVDASNTAVTLTIANNDITGIRGKADAANTVSVA